MKNLLLSSFILFISMGIFSSCGDNTKSEPPKLDGKWLIVERTAQTNHPDVDLIINGMFKEDSKRYTVERQFLKIKPEFEESDVITTATKDGVVSRRLDERYSVSNDSLKIKDMLVGYPVQYQYLLSYTVLTTTRKVNKKELAYMLAWIGMTDPNGITILPSDIVGEIRTKEVRLTK